MKLLPRNSVLHEDLLLLNMLIESGNLKEVLKHINHPKHPLDNGRTEHESFRMRQMSPVALAACLGRVDIMSTLIREGFDAHTLTSGDYGCPRRAPIHFACQEGRKEVVKTLILEHGVNVDSQDGYRCTPLYIAVSRGELEIVKILVDFGASINTPYDDVNQTTLLHLAVKGRQLEMCRYLIRKGADVDARDKWKTAPLHLASRQGHDEIVKILLESGADPNIEDSSRVTPAIHATEGCHLTTLKVLVSYGGDPEAEDENGKTVLDHALLTFRKDVIQYLVVTRNVSPRGICQHLLDTYLRDAGDGGKDIMDIFVEAGHDRLFGISGQPVTSSRSLQELCCFKIRRSVGKVLPSCIQSLPLPVLLKDFVMLSHVKNEL